MWFISGLGSAGVVLGFVAIAAAVRRAALPAAFSPVLLTALAIGVLLLAVRIPIERFEALTMPLRWLIGPAIVALGATLQVNRPILRRAGRPLVIAVAVGTVAGVASAFVLARVLDLGPLLTAATSTRTVTSPFAILVQARIGGPVALGAALAVLTGVIGAIILPMLLKSLGFRSAAEVGIATGVAAHIVGTDALGRRDALAGSFAAVALIGTGILVAVGLPPLWPYLVG